ncbi:hypothetical protein [Glycomyces arizonensis]|uniref:hypothetical protein n=1 Tax=Glycomyces arizonensis TaxID=256035 RepID=UPI00041BE123|nr:hypothetical protein [Glycomyces arizonensis]
MGDGYERISVDTDTGNWVKNVDRAIPGSDINVVNGLMSAPGLSHLNNIGSGIWDMASGEMDLEAGVTQIVATVADLGFQTAGLAADPLGTLIGWGLDILIGLIQPLEDLIHMVSGDPGAMRDTAAVWGRVAEADADLSQALAGTLTPMAEWTTADGVACRGRIDDLAASVFQLAKCANGLQTVLQAAQALAELIKGAVKWLLSQLVKYFVMVVAPQVAASIVTLGASLASAIGLAAVQTSYAILKATKFTTRITMAFGELAQAFAAFAKEALPGMVVGSLQGSGASLPDGPATSGGGPAAGPGDGGAVDPEVIREASPTVTKIAEDAAGVADVVSTTAADEMTWGLCGVAGWVGQYDEKVQELQGLASAASATLNAFASNMRAAADDWQSADDEIATAFNDLDGDLASTGG